MNMPKPEDMGQAPAWDNYLVAQAVQASLGLIPRNATGISLTISDSAVKFDFQLSEVSEGDEIDIEDIISNFNMLIGFVVPVTSTQRVVKRRELKSPSPRVRWIFSRHAD